MRAAIKAAELLYRGVNRLRRNLYRAGILRGKRLPKPVVSVGNVAAGGTGKTPAVIAIARRLTERGYRVAVLTRGYRKSGEGGRIESLDATKYGDEPTLIKARCPKADVIVGANRYENAVGIDCDLFILDDGFQHLQLARDLDIVIDVPDAPFFREGRSALRHADVVIPRSIRSDTSAVRGKPAYAFAGLADNVQFFRMLALDGVPIVGTRGFPDHHTYSLAEIAAIRHDARNSRAEVIVTTEKDAVKVRQPDIVAVPIEFDVPEIVFQKIEALLAR